MRSHRAVLIKGVEELSAQQNQSARQEIEQQIARAAKNIMVALNQMRSQLDKQGGEANALYWRTHKITMWAIGVVATAANLIAILLIVLLPKSVVRPIRNVIDGLRHFGLVA